MPSFYEQIFGNQLGVSYNETLTTNNSQNLNEGEPKSTKQAKNLSNTKVKKPKKCRKNRSIDRNLNTCSNEKNGLISLKSSLENPEKNNQITQHSFPTSEIF